MLHCSRRMLRAGGRAVLRRRVTEVNTLSLYACRHHTLTKTVMGPGLSLGGVQAPLSLRPVCIHASERTGITRKDHTKSPSAPSSTPPPLQ
eukprot:536055-Rhodomonas_salina.1